MYVYSYYISTSLHLQHAELATKAMQEKEKKIKQLRAELKRTEGENCGKPAEDKKLMAKIAKKEKNHPEPEARFKTSKNKQKVVFITILPCFY